MKLALLPLQLVSTGSSSVEVESACTAHTGVIFRWTVRTALTRWTVDIRVSVQCTEVS